MTDSATCRTTVFGNPCDKPAEYLVCGKGVTTHVACHACAVSWYRANRHAIVIRLGKNWEPAPVNT